MEFDPKSENQLGLLDDDDLIEYISAARDAGQQDQMRTGLGIFVFRRRSQIVNRIRLKVDSDHDIEDLTMRVITDVMAARFDGTYTGEMVNLINTVTQRRIADFCERRSRIDEVPLPGTGGDDESRGPEPDSGEDFPGEVEMVEIITNAIDGLSESHALVVRLSLTGLPGASVAERVNHLLPGSKNPMTEANVHQIMKRFRGRIEGVLEESER